jgi:hypothetical protein
MRYLAFMTVVILCCGIGATRAAGELSALGAAAGPLGQSATPVACVVSPAFEYLLAPVEQGSATPDPQQLAAAQRIIDRRTRLLDDPEYGPIASVVIPVDIDPARGRVRVQLEDIQDRELVERLLQEPGLFAVLHTGEVKLPPGMEAARLSDFPAILDSTSIETASVTFDGTVIFFKWLPDDAERWQAFQREHQGTMVALVLDDTVKISGAVGNQPQPSIQGLEPRELRLLAIMLYSGPLPARLEISGPITDLVSEMGAC